MPPKPPVPPRFPPPRSPAPHVRSMSEVTPYVLEGGRPLSQSLLWRLQREYYQQEGSQAWAKGTVPYYITSNPWIANTYAKVAFGWLRDCFPALDLHHPVHIVELGCGSGRFGYLFLNRLLDLLSRSPLEAVKVRYVLTDFTESTLEPLRKHPLLLPMIEEGLIEIARFDATEETEIQTRHGVLSPKTSRNPLAVLANYVFDSLPQDAFATHDGQLFELCPTLMIPEAGRDPGDPGLLPDIHVFWEERPAALGYYGDPELDAILAEYAQGLEDTTILLPCAGLRCLQNLSRLSHGRFLLLSGDKGYSREELLLGRGEPEIETHGSLSMMVNYHALGRWFVHQGGEILHTSHFQSNLSVVACLLGTPGGAPLETRMAFDDAIERGGPDDFFDLRLSVQESSDAMSLGQLLSWIRFSGWDARIFENCFPALIKHLPSASGELRAELLCGRVRGLAALFPHR